MSRRDTIIISVLVNAALLAVLFITAVTSKKPDKEDVKLSASTNLEETTIDAKELFSANIDNKDAEAPKEEISPEIQKEFVSLIEENQNVKKDEQTVLYKLPEVAKSVETEKTVVSPVLTEPSIPKILVDNITVTVKKGDTLEKIARANHVKIEDIIKINNLSNNFLKIGQALVMPAKNTQTTTAEKKSTTPFIAKSQPEYYTIKVGDNPYTIAVKHNLKLSDILKINNLDEKKARKLKPGDKLRIR